MQGGGTEEDGFKRGRDEGRKVERKVRERGGKVERNEGKK